MANIKRLTSRPEQEEPEEYASTRELSKDVKCIFWLVFAFSAGLVVCIINNPAFRITPGFIAGCLLWSVFLAAMKEQALQEIRG